MWRSEELPMRASTGMKKGFVWFCLRWKRTRGVIFLIEGGSKQVSQKARAWQTCVQEDKGDGATRESFVGKCVIVSSPKKKTCTPHVLSLFKYFAGGTFV